MKVELNQNDIIMLLTSYSGENSKLKVLNQTERKAVQKMLDVLSNGGSCNCDDSLIKEIKHKFNKTPKETSDFKKFWKGFANLFGRVSFKKLSSSFEAAAANFNTQSLVIKIVPKPVVQPAPNGAPLPKAADQGAPSPLQSIPSKTIPLQPAQAKPVIQKKTHAKITAKQVQQPQQHPKVPKTTTEIAKPTKINSSPVIIATSGNTEPLKPLGSGMDKVYYLPAQSQEGIHMGFLNTSEDVKLEELQAYNKLTQAMAGTEVNVPKVIDDIDLKAPVIITKGDGKIAIGSGYWIQHIPNLKNFKPIQAAISQEFAKTFGGKNNPIKIYNQFMREGKHQEADKLKTGINAIRENALEICGLVGEVTLGVNGDTGEVFLLDVAPKMGQTAADQAPQIILGLNNILNELVPAKQ